MMTALITDKPILFSSPMVRALRANRKTQTRRVMKPQPEMRDGCCPYWNGYGGYYGGNKWHSLKFAVGDTIYVKEATWMWCERRPNGTTKTGRPKWHYVPLQSAPVVYLATDGTKKPTLPISHPETGNQWGWKYKTGRFMPRWARRISLKVTAVKIERLWDISETDAWAEGIEEVDGVFDVQIPEMAMRHSMSIEDGKTTFACLWESINGEGSWDQNPWVTAVSFERL